MSYSSIVLATAGLQYYWRLNETTGTSAADSQGTNTGTYTGTYTLGTAGIDGNCLSVAGSGYVLTTTHPLNSFSHVTAEAWVRISANPGAAQAVALFNDGSATDKQLYIDTSGRPNWYVYDGAGKVVTGTALILDQWHHLVGTADGTTSTLYVDGASVASRLAGNTYTSFATGTTGTFRIGQAATGLANFVGLVDEAAVYNLAIPLADVQSHFWAGFNQFLVLGTLAKPTAPVLQSAWSSNLLAAYNLGEGSGTAADLSGNAHTGTLTGSCTWSSGAYGTDLALADNGTTGSYLALGNISALSGVTAFTFSCLAYLDTYTDSPRGGNERFLIGTNRAGAAVPQACIYYHAASKTIRFRARYGDFADLVAAAPPLNQWVLFTGRVNSNVQSLWYDGVKVAEQAVASYAYASDITPVGVVGDSPAVQAGNNWSGHVAMPLFAARGYSDAEIGYLAGDPFVWDRGIAATLAATEARDTLADTATFAASGALSSTEALDSLAGVGIDTSPASLASTEGPDTLAATGAETMSASLAVTEGGDTLGAAAGLDITGALASTEGQDTLAGTSGLSVTADLSAAESGDSLIVTFGVNLVVIEGRDTLSATGAETMTATLVVIEGNDILTESIRLSNLASLVVTEGRDTLALSLAQLDLATLVVIEGNDLLAGVAVASSLVLDPYGTSEAVGFDLDPYATVTI